MEAVQKRGRGRPRFAVVKHEVRLGAKDIAALKAWQRRCGEKERGRAFRRALAVAVEPFWGLSVREVCRGLRVTVDALDPSTAPFVEERCDVNLSEEDLVRFEAWRVASGETDKGRAWRRLIHVLGVLEGTEALAVAIQGTKGVAT